MKVGVFSGSFNPIHIGHLILANYIVEFTDIDEVWFLVSPHNPLKDTASLHDETERLHMVELALVEYPKLKACDFELALPKPSYTVNTMSALREAYPDTSFTLIIGADNWDNFEKWRDYDKLIEAHKIMVYPRLGYRVSIPAKLRNSVIALDSPIVEISSTFIRESIEEGKNVQAFLPKEVYSYIMEHKIYK